MKAFCMSTGCPPLCGITQLCEQLCGSEWLLITSKAMCEGRSVLSHEVEVTGLIDSLFVFLSLLPVPIVLSDRVSLIAQRSDLNLVWEHFVFWTWSRADYYNSPRNLHKAPGSTRTVTLSPTHSHKVVSSVWDTLSPSGSLCSFSLFGDWQAHRGRYTMLMSQSWLNTQKLQNTTFTFNPPHYCCTVTARTRLETHVNPLDIWQITGTHEPSCTGQSRPEPDRRKMR